MGKQKKSLVLGALFLFAFMFAVSGVYAMEADNVTIVTPGASGTLSGSSALFNISLITGYEAENWTSVRIWLVSSALTANTTEALATDWVTNETDLILNGTLDSTVFEDGNDYTFKAQLFNGTDYINQTRTGITIDNTIPQTPTLSPASQTEVTSSSTQTFTGTVTDENTTSCTYTIARGGASSGQDYISGSGTYSGSSCTFTKSFTSTLDNGVWYWSITASDETNTTASGQNQFVVSLPGSGGGFPSGSGTGDATSGDGEGSGLGWLIGVVAVIAIIGLGYFIFREN